MLEILGYPIEFIPLANPYDMHPGHAMSFEPLLNGEPLGNQLVYIGTKTKDHSHDGQGHFHGGDAEHSHSHDHSDESSDDHSHGMKLFRTDANGVLRVNIDHEGIWYLRTIHLVESDEGGLTHESNWATLTFEIGEGHSHEHAHAEDEGEHTHGHDEGGIPEYVWWLGSFLLVIILFFIFNRQSK